LEGKENLKEIREGFDWISDLTFGKFPSETQSFIVFSASSILQIVDLSKECYKSELNRIFEGVWQRKFGTLRAHSTADSAEPSVPFDQEALLLAPTTIINGSLFNRIELMRNKGSTASIMCCKCSMYPCFASSLAICPKAVQAFLQIWSAAVKVLINTI
jgi:hypothetical protein